MKKIFMLALAAMTLTVVSCKKDSATAGKDSDSTKKELKEAGKALSVEEQAEEYCKQMLEAMKSGKEDAIEKVSKEAEKWQKGLSEEDQAKAEKAAEAYMNAHEKEAQEAFAAALAAEMAKQGMGESDDFSMGDNEELEMTEED